MLSLENLRSITDRCLKSDISGKSRVRHNVYARIIYSYIAKNNTNNCFRIIGEEINRDHATVIYHVRIFNELKKYDDFYKMYLTVMRNLVYTKSREESKKPKINICNNFSVGCISFFPTFPAS